MTNLHYYSNIDLGEGILTTDGAKSSQIKVGIIGRLGDVIEVVTLEDLARTGDQHQIFMANYGHVGEVVYELWTPGNEIVLTKLAHLRTLPCSPTTWLDTREQGNQKNLYDRPRI